MKFRYPTQEEGCVHIWYYPSYQMTKDSEGHNSMIFTEKVFVLNVKKWRI